MITADVFRQFLPTREPSRSLALIPAAGATPSATGGDFNSPTERDILYKLFFDLKKDMNEMKKMMLDMAHQQGYTPPGLNENFIGTYSNEPVPVQVNTQPTYTNSSTPILIPHTEQPHEDVEETLLLSDKEKEMIVKALKKHKSRRRDAANELGISERTLYRKIKEYDIKE
jgi:transcriptional regulator with AAA-type ATPase domain